MTFLLLRYLGWLLQSLKLTSQENAESATPFWKLYAVYTFSVLFATPRTPMLSTYGTSAFLKLDTKLRPFFLVPFNSVTHSCPTLCDTMEGSMSGLPGHHQLLEFTQLMSIESAMPSNHLILCCPFSSHLQSFWGSGFFKWVNSSHQVAKVLEFQFQHQSFQWIFRTDFL